MTPSAYLTDKDVCAILRISPRTLYELLRHGPGDNCSFDLRDCAPVRIGRGRRHSQRRWDAMRFAEVTGLTYRQIWDALA